MNSNAGKKIRIPSLKVNHSKDVIDRFWSFVKEKPEDGCWIWSGPLSKRGYGIFYVGHKTIRANRYSLALLIGEIPENMCACHKCDNPTCVRQDHLFLGTHQDNMSDAASKKRFKPKRGDEHWHRKYPERIARGENHWTARIKGRIPFGEKQWKSLLTESIVIAIRRRVKLGEKIKEIAKDLGFHEDTVQKAASGKNWKHVPFPE